MPRRPRLDAPGTVHHVWSRGIEKRRIFLDEDDRADFVDRLGSILTSPATPCLAWCLMDNHVHLVLQTGERPLWKVLHRLKTGFAVRFNRRHDRSGHLFQNRYDSRPVTSDSDLMNLIRYVHLNPIRGGVLASLAALERYPWCGHASLLGRRPALSFESVQLALNAFGEDADTARSRLREWMEVPFVEELSPAPEGGPSLPDLTLRVSSLLGVDPGDLRAGKRGRRLSRARAILCHLAITEGGMLIREVARELDLSPGGACRAAQRGRALLGDGEVNS